MGLSAANEGEETARVERWLDVGERITEFFATAQLEACARRTFKLTGKVCLALVTLGTGSTRQTSLGDWRPKRRSDPRRWTFRPKRCTNAGLSGRWPFYGHASNEPWPNSRPETRSVRQTSVPRLRRCLWRTVRGLSCRLLSRSGSRGVVGVRARPGPKFSWCGSSQP